MKRFLFNFNRIFVLGALAIMPASIKAQDMVAHQASKDNSVKNVNSVILRSSLSAANLANPANNIYSSWDNSGVNRVTGYAPENMKIDLRGFTMPTPSRVVTSKFGPRWHRQHQGLDIKVYIGDTIRAAFDGKVRVVKYDANGYGKYVVIRHPNGLETLYGHMSKQLVEADDIVKSGQPIGLGGNTGRSTGSHLHFETRIVGKPIDPALIFDFVNQDVTGDYFFTNASYSKESGKSAVVNASSSKSSHNSYISMLGETPSRTKAEEPKAEAKTSVKNDDTAEENSNKNDDSKLLSSNESHKAHKASASSKKANSNKTYRVKKGDTLYSIARSNGLTLRQLCKMNGIKESKVIYDGLVLKTS